MMALQCKVTRDELLESLQSVVGVVEARQSVQILSHVLLELHHDKLVMQCTDNEMAITSYATVEQVISTGSTTVSAYTLLEIVRRLPRDAMVSLKQKDGKVLVDSESSHFCLMSLPADGFPSPALEKNPTTVTVSEGALYQAIKATYFAMAQNNPRYYLNGMLWDLRQGQLQVVATDAHRLAQRWLAVTSEETAALIVPRKTVLELSKLLTEDNKKEVSIGFTEHQLSISSTSYTLLSRLIAGTFPDYKKLLPTSVQRTAIVDRDLFKEVLGKLTPLVKQEIHKGVRLEFDKNRLTLKVSNSKRETGEESFEIYYEGLNDQTFVIAFNIDYLDKILDVLGPGKIKLTLPQQEGVTVFEKDQASKDHVYLLMPILL